jgi:NAD(P)-dependent dehydrogenase (short-subunit alcohol dehydrogenase family)
MSGMRGPQQRTYEGKVAVVTGGGSGIGRALCEELGRRGASVVVADIRDAAAREVSDCITGRGGRASAVTVDVSDPERIRHVLQAVAREHGRLDYLFNNAGFAVVGELRDVSVEDWRRIVDVNLLGVVYGALSAYEIMREQSHGHIVNVASLAGLIGAQSMTPYAATKAAVIAFSSGLRFEAATFGVGVSAVCPGFVESSIYENSVTARLERHKVRELVPFKMMPAARAANEILAGVERNEAVLVFPRYARVLWWLARMQPRAAELFRRRSLRELRAQRVE